jgi:hypothetical protein
MRSIFAAVLVTAAMVLPSPRAAALETNDLLALVAMPLAVAAVSEATDVPMSDLIDVVTLLNDAAVPPAQFIEVVRYVPATLVVETDRPRFVDFLRTEEQQGVVGTALVTQIERELPYYGISDVNLDVSAPRLVDFDENTFVPPIVQTRIAEARQHPHGGPPGQLKKELGLQTGAEVVHGQRMGGGRTVVATRQHDEDRSTAVRHSGKEHHAQARPQKIAKTKGASEGHSVQTEVAKPSHGMGHGNGGTHGGGHGGGHGKGKGKG